MEGLIFYKQRSLFTVSWHRGNTNIIQNCFGHCGFKHLDLEMPNKADGENDVILETHHVGNYEEF
jgi:hypothetical protein